MEFEKGESSTSSSVHKVTKDMVLVFPPPSPPKTPPQEHQKVTQQREIPESKLTFSNSPTKVSQLSQVAEILKRHMQAPRWWINKITRSSTYESNSMNGRHHSPTRQPNLSICC